MTSFEQLLNAIRELPADQQRALGDLLRAEHGNGPGPANSDAPLLGLLSDDPQLADQISEMAMHARESRPLRMPCERVDP